MFCRSSVVSSWLWPSTNYYTSLPLTSKSTDFPKSTTECITCIGSSEEGFNPIKFSLWPWRPYFLFFFHAAFIVLVVTPCKALSVRLIQLWMLKYFFRIFFRTILVLPQSILEILLLYTVFWNVKWHSVPWIPSTKLDSFNNVYYKLGGCPLLGGT